MPSGPELAQLEKAQRGSHVAVICNAAAQMPSTFMPLIARAVLINRGSWVHYSICCRTVLNKHRMATTKGHTPAAAMLPLSMAAMCTLLLLLAVRGAAAAPPANPGTSPKQSAAPGKGVPTCRLQVAVYFLMQHPVAVVNSMEAVLGAVLASDSLPHLCGSSQVLGMQGHQHQESQRQQASHHHPRLPSPRQPALLQHRQSQLHRQL